MFTPSMHVNPNTDGVRQLIAAAYPEYRGRKCRVSVFAGPMSVNSYWDGGSREYFTVVRLSDCVSLGLPTSHPVFDRKPDGSRMGALEIRELPAGLALAKHAIFCGTDAGITIYVNASNLDALALPMSPALTADERTVLEFTRSRKASYAGISNYRLTEAQRTTGITLERWNVAKVALIGRKLLNQAGAITDAGRNALDTSPRPESLRAAGNPESEPAVLDTVVDGLQNALCAGVQS